MCKSLKMVQEILTLKCLNQKDFQEPLMTAEIEKEHQVSNGTSQKKQQKGDILDLVGGDGPWQRRIFLVILFCAIPSATHNLSMSFLAPNLDHWCARPDGTNLTVEQWKTIGLPPDDHKCSRYENLNLSLLIEDIENATERNKDIVACEAWEYDETIYTSTVLSQWDLVCEKEWLVSLSKSIFMGGILFSILLFGHIADRLGRRPAIAASAFIAVSSAVICAFSTSFIMFIVARFFIAVGIAGVFNTSFVLLMEIVGAEYRSFYGIAVEFGWCIGFVSLPGIAWLLRDWFWIQIALTAPCLVLLAIWWMLPESPRWLMSQGKIDEAQKTLSRAANANGVKLSDIDTTMKKMLTKASEVHESGEAKGNILDLIRTPGLRSMTFNVYFLWFVNAFVYYGLSYNTNELAGNPFVNFALSGAVEFPAYVLTIFAIRSLGRRNPLAASMIIGGIACILAYPLPEDPWWIGVTVAMIGKFCITISFAIAFVFTAEIFPTVVRNTGLGSASLFARFGSIMAPFVRELGNATHPVVGQVVFGVLAAASGLLVLLLPETNNTIVPDTLKEAAEVSSFHRKGKSGKAQNGHHVVISLTAEETEVSSAQEESIPEVSPPSSSSKPVENGKKLEDVPEEDLHVDDADENQTEAPETTTNPVDPSEEASEETQEAPTAPPEESITVAESSCENPELKADTAVDVVVEGSK